MKNTVPTIFSKALQAFSLSIGMRILCQIESGSNLTHSSIHKVVVMRNANKGKGSADNDLLKHVIIRFH